jgi:dTDP-4-amino-4,6-dideoxygalactose transaminase
MISRMPIASYPPGTRKSKVANIPFLDLSVKDDEHRAELINAVEKMLDHGRVVLGPEVTEFEERIASLTGRRYAIGVGSGTDALYLALRTLDLEAGDEVITTALSWIATFNAIAACGAIPVAIDVDDEMNMDVSKLEASITPKTKAIVAVHFNGLMCDMAAICSIAEQYGLKVVEDAAQAIGATCDGRPSAGYGDIAALSFNAMKILRAYGDAGAVLTDDALVRDRLCSLRYGGTVDRETCVEVSLNFRMDTIQAAMLLVNLGRLDAIIEKRRKVAASFTRQLSDVVVCPIEPSLKRHVYYVYTIRAKNRDGLRDYLQSQGVETKIYHPVPMPDQPAYAHLNLTGIPKTRQICSQILSLPAHEDMGEEDIEYICGAIRKYY